MMRNDWQFEYTASKLAQAAKEQAEFRMGRVKVWEEKKEEVMQKIRESGLTVHEDIAEKMSGKYTNYSTLRVGGPQILVDPTMQRDLSECSEKIQTHRKLQKEYEGWMQILSSNPESRLILDSEDWRYFFGK